VFASLPSALRTVLFASFSLGATWGAQAATMGQLPFIPTRFHLCSVELDGLEGDAREDEMRECLQARFHAEKMVRSECAKQMKTLRPAPKNADERYQVQRDCFIQHLSLSYKDLFEDAEASEDATAKFSKAVAANTRPAAHKSATARPSAPARTASSSVSASKKSEITVAATPIPIPIKSPESPSAAPADSAI
jgi:hypothetical protein